MKAVWGIVFAASLVTLLFVVIRNRFSAKWFGFAASQILIAALLLYGVSLSESYTNIHLPINGITVLTVTVLGVPGLALLFAVHTIIL